MFSAEAFAGFANFSPDQPAGPVTLFSLLGGAGSTDSFDAGTTYEQAYEGPPSAATFQAGGSVVIATETTTWYLWNNGEAVKPKYGDKLEVPSWTVNGVDVETGPIYLKIESVGKLGLGILFECRCTLYV
jgi:hypothetical protein